MTLGLDSGRALDPARYALGGRAPRAALRPQSREELVEALRAAALEKLAIVPWGGGVGLASEPPPERYDLALDLSGLDRVIEYEPGDFTLTAECGVTLASLRARLLARGQELPLEGAHADRATLGGVLAANASGPRRLRFGSPRDRILGARFALADGTFARSGGKVVKNVAGYGIHRLLCGSRGGLAVIVEASLKLAPGPAARVALVYWVPPERITDAALWQSFPRLEPAFLTVVGGVAARTVVQDISGPAEPALRSAAERSGFAVVIGLEDDASWVERQVALTTEALGSPVTRIEGDEALALGQSLADLEEQDGPRLSLTAPHNTPVALGPLLGHPAAARMVFHAPAGRLHLFPEASAAQALVELLAERGFSLIGARNLPDLEPPIAPMVATLRLRSRIRKALDPERQMALGERWERGVP